MDVCPARIRIGFRNLVGGVRRWIFAPTPKQEMAFAWLGERLDGATSGWARRSGRPRPHVCHTRSVHPRDE